ncbi:MAG: TrbC/VirB2 family protein [Bdellovibrionales bacterium]|nr:TrbC/VirB2 family protein [Bdellovibrionales bacterium]
MKNKKTLMIGLCILGVVAFSILFPDLAQAALGGVGFESRMESLTNKLISVVLPAVSILGLVYAVLLAMTGDGAAKSRIIMVIVCSVVGFMAPHIIRWFQSATGS